MSKPDGESFKRELREWRSWVEPHITDINTKLENLQNEIRALHQITFNNKSNKEDTTKKMQEIQQSMQDNNKHITKAYMIIEVLEPESVGDETTRVYLEKRRRQLAEREMKQQSYEEELSQAQTVLREIDVQQPMIEKKLDDFVLDETQIRKSKESLESAMRKWRFQIDLFDGEGGWVRSLERPEPSFRADGVDGFQ
jgi:chromosome segregation ATPase